jgi:hypothetical protein
MLTHCRLASSVSRGTISKFEHLGAAVAVRTALSVVEQTTAASHTCTMNIAESLQAVLIELVIALLLAVPEVSTSLRYSV